MTLLAQWCGRNLVGGEGVEHLFGEDINIVSILGGEDDIILLSSDGELSG